MKLNHQLVACRYCMRWVSRPNRNTHREACERTLAMVILTLHLRERAVFARLDRERVALNRLVAEHLTNFPFLRKPHA